VVECDLAKVEVAGSNPVSRSRKFAFRVLPKGRRSWTFSASGATLDFRARYPSGKGEVCKTFMRRFDSDPRLHPLASSSARWKSILRAVSD
jgi:hypothetical protein